MGTTDFQTFVAELEEREAARTATSTLFGTIEPDAMAEGVELGDQLGVSPEIAASQAEVFRSQVQQETATQALLGAPKTAGWVRDPVNGALVKDDLDNLTTFEKSFGAAGRAVGRGARQTSAAVPYVQATAAGTMLADIGKSLDDIIAEELQKVGGNQAPAASRVAALQVAQVRFNAIKNLTEEDRPALLRQGAQSFARAQEIVALTQSMPMSKAAEGFRDGAFANAENTFAGALGAFVVDPAGGAAFIAETAAETLPILAAAAGTTAVTRSPTTGAIVAGGGAFLRENTSAALDFLAERGVPLETVDDAMALLQSPELMREAQEFGVTRGLIIAAFDAVSGGVAGQTLVKSPVGDVVTQGLAQAFLGGGGEAAAQMATDGEISPRDVVVEALAEIATTPVEIVGVGGRRIARAAEGAMRSGATAETLAKIDELAQNSKLRERAPDRFQAALDAQGLDLDAIYVPSGAVREYFQSSDRDIGELSAWGIDQETFDEAEASGADLAIPLSTYATRIAGSDDAAWLQQNATIDPDELSVADAQAFNESVAEIVQEEISKAEEARSREEAAFTSDAQVYDDVYQQLRDTGRTPEAADKEARVWSAFFRTMAERSGQDPADAFSVRIERSDQAGDLQQDQRGSIRIPKQGVTSGETVINLFETSDMSTFMHESGHFFLEAMDAFTTEDAPQDMRDDMAAIRKFVGAKEGKAFSTDQHEKWARAFEAYLMEGKAPSLELADAFSRFKAWLTRLYRSAAGLNIRLTDEIRQVMDRMLATEAELAEARAVQEMSPLFASEKPPGMSDGDYRTYQRMARRSAEQAEQRLLKRTMDRVRREREAWYRAETKAVRDQVEQEVNQRREYQLIEAVANERVIGEETDVPDLRIDRQELIDQFGKDVLSEISRSRLGGKRALHKTDGLAPQEVAEMFGYGSATEMIDILRNTRKRKDQIDAEVERIMLDRYGDPLNDGTIEEEALSVIHSEQQMKTSVAEARHLAGRLGRTTRGMQPKIYRQRARMMLEGMTVRDAIKPRHFLKAERQASARAQAAFARVARSGGEAALADALQAKEQQILNGYLYDEAVAFEKEMSKRREKMRAYDKKSVREKLEGGYIEQIDAILEHFDFRKRTPGQVARSENLAAFVDRMIEEGREGELNIDARLIGDARRRHYTQMSVDEIRGLFDTVDNLDHLGRRKQQLIDRKKKRDFQKTVDVVVTAVQENLGTGKAGEESRARTALNLLWSADTILSRLDGGKDSGAVYEQVKRAIDDGASEEQRMSVELAEKMDELFSAYSAKDLAAMSREKSIPGGNGREWSKLEILSVALNSGNDDNLQRLLHPGAHEKNRLTPDQHQALLATLDESDWQFVQGMWDLIDSYWGQLSEVEKRRTGVTPKKVQARPVETSFGTYRGGYYPIKYDPALAAMARDDEKTAWDKFVSTGRGSRAAIKNGMVKAREASSGGRTLMLDLQVPFTHLRDTIRFTSMSEAVDNSFRLLNNIEVKQAFLDAGKATDLDTLNLWLKDVAQGPIYNRDFVNSAARFIKNNFTLARLAFNMKTIALQVTGLGQSAATIGKRNLLDGMLAYGKAPSQMLADIEALSPFMAERKSTFQKDIYDIANDVQLNTPLSGRATKLRNEIARWGFLPIVATQFYVVDVPTWAGAYQSRLSGGATQEDAIAYADRMVARAQASGLMADRAAIERGTLSESTRQNDFVRLFTTLGSYMLAKMNRGYMRIIQGKEEFADAHGAAKLAVSVNLATDMMLLYVFEGALMALGYSLLTDDEEPEDVAQFIGVETLSAMTGGIPFVRDAVSAFRGYGGGGVYGSVAELPFRAFNQVNQGENDSALRRAIADMVGTATGLPSTATIRLIEGLIDDEQAPAEMLLGRNPLSDR